MKVSGIEPVTSWLEIRQVENTTNGATVLEIYDGRFITHF
jgi:hypothetical protein